MPATDTTARAFCASNIHHEKRLHISHIGKSMSYSFPKKGNQETEQRGPARRVQALACRVHRNTRARGEYYADEEGCVYEFDRQDLAVIMAV